MKRQNDGQEIARLLSKFMAGTTSVAEEQALAQYFRTHDVGEEWAEYKEMFALFDSGEVDIEIRKKPKIVALRWGMAAVAASALLLLVLRLGQGSVEEKPAVTYTASVQQSTQQPVTPPIVEEKTEAVVAEVQPTPQPVKQQRRAVRKHSTQTKPSPAETSPKPMSAETVPEQKDPAATPSTLHPSEQDPFLQAAAQTQDIRSRGERLYQEIAQLMNNP